MKICVGDNDDINLNNGIYVMLIQHRLLHSSFLQITVGIKAFYHPQASGLFNLVIAFET